MREDRQHRADGGYLIGSANCLTDHWKIENMHAMSSAPEEYVFYPI